MAAFQLNSASLIIKHGANLRTRERDKKASRRADAEGKGRRLCQSKFHRSKGDLGRQKQKLIEYAKSRGYQDIEVIAIVTSFAGRIYRSTSNKKIEVVKAVKNAVGDR
jgi:predicted site-specific integrase-resolvase